MHAVAHDCIVLHGGVWYHASPHVFSVRRSFVSDIDPADATIGRRALPETFTPDLVDTPATPRKAEREGLPPSYRMRADAHYVDQLSSRRAHADTPRAPRDADALDLDPAGDPRRDGRDRKSDRAFAALAEDLATIESAASLLGEDTSPLGRRVSLDLIKAHAWRASWLLKAQALVDGPVRGHFRARSLAPLLLKVRDGLAAECRLSGTTLDLQAVDWQASCQIDEAGLTTGVTGAVMATLGLMGPADGAAIKLTLVTAGDAPAIEISQDAVAVRASVAQRFLDPAWVDRPGGWTAALGAGAARTAAHQHGGSATFVLGDVRGSVLRLTLARGA
jgi:hypothetical protein